MGRVRWVVSVHQAPWDVAVASGVVVAAARETHVVGLDAETGAQAWDLAVGTGVRSIDVAGERCLVLGQDGVLRCVDVRTGEPRNEWRGPRLSGHVAPVGDVVVSGGWRGYSPLCALDAATGGTVWSTRDAVRTVLPHPVGDAVLIGEPGTRLVRLVGAHDGAQRAAWRLPAPLVDGDLDPVCADVAPGRVAVTCDDGVIAEIDVAAGSAREVARTGVPAIAGAPVVVGDAVWARERRSVAAVALDGSGMRWRLATQEHPAGVVAVDGGAVIADGCGATLHVDHAGTVVARLTGTGRLRGLYPLPDGGLLLAGKGSLFATDATPLVPRRPPRRGWRAGRAGGTCRSATA